MTDVGSYDDDEAERAWQEQIRCQLQESGVGDEDLEAEANRIWQEQIRLQQVQMGYLPESALDVPIDDEEAERAWREALAASQEGDDGMEVDPDAERAWQEAMAEQQEALDLQDDAYYEELYRNTRLNEESSCVPDGDLQELNEQRWRLREKMAAHEADVKNFMEDSKALSLLRSSTLRGTASKKPLLKPILRKRLERVKIERRLTLRMINPLTMLSPETKKKSVKFADEDESMANALNTGDFTDEMFDDEETLKRLLEETENELKEQEFLEMSLQFLDDYAAEEQRLREESDEIRRMEEQVRKLEEELSAAGGDELGNDEGLELESVPAVEIADGTNSNLEMRIKRGTKPFGGQFISEVQKLLHDEANSNATENNSNEYDDEYDEPDNLAEQVRRGTKGTSGVFIAHGAEKERQKIEEEARKKKEEEDARLKKEAEEKRNRERLKAAADSNAKQTSVQTAKPPPKPVTVPTAPKPIVGGGFASALAAFSTPPPTSNAPPLRSALRTTAGSPAPSATNNRNTATGVRNFAGTPSSTPTPAKNTMAATKPNVTTNTAVANGAAKTTTTTTSIGSGNRALSSTPSATVSNTTTTTNNHWKPAPTPKPSPTPSKPTTTVTTTNSNKGVQTNPPAAGGGSGLRRAPVQQNSAPQSFQPPPRGVQGSVRVNPNPDPVKRGVGRPTTLSPGITAKTSLFEVVVDSEEEKRRQARRQRLDLARGKILAKTKEDPTALLPKEGKPFDKQSK